MTQRRHLPFNMIEIVLALGLVAVGIVSIMALFPVAVNASRDGMTESYAANTADQFLHQQEYLIRESAGGWAKYITDSSPEIPGAELDPADLADFEIPADGTAEDGTRDTLWAKDGEKGIFKAIRYVDKGSGGEGTYEEDTDILDFEAIIAVWQDDLDILGTGKRAVAVALNLEVSWPAKLPHAQRQKSLYRFELFNR